jgi:hypothetical protein
MSMAPGLRKEQAHRMKGRRSTMKRTLLMMALAVAITVNYCETTDACTASDMVTRAQDVNDSDAYDTVLSVITDEFEDRWERDEAYEAAVGTVMVEYVIKVAGGSEGYWDTSDPGYQYYGLVVTNQATEEQRAAFYGAWVEDTTWNYADLDDESYVENFLETSSAGPAMFWKHPGGMKVKDHAELHGDDWDAGYDSIYDYPVEDWYEIETEYADHGG